MAKRNLRQSRSRTTPIVLQGVRNTPKPLKISACWIVKNEEKNLARSIRSVSRLVDELIIVDTGSEDATVEIAESLKAKVYAFEWINDFSAARNYALSKASGDVIVFLDADEFFHPALARRDRLMIDQVFADARYDSMMLKLTNIDDDSGKVLSIEENIRIFRRRPDMVYTGSIHETIQKMVAERPTPLQSYLFLAWNINHTGYSPRIFVSKLQRNIESLETAVSQTEDPFELFTLHSYLLREYKAARLNEPAFPHLQYMLDHPEHFESAFRFMRAGFLLRVLNALEVAFFLRSRTSRIQLSSAILPPAKIYYEEDAYQLIYLHYLILFDFRPDAFLTNYTPISSQFESSENLARPGFRQGVAFVQQYACTLYLYLGDAGKAFEVIDKVIRDPDNYSPHTFSLLMDCLYGQPDDVVIPYLYQVLDFDRLQTFFYLSDALILVGRKNAFLFMQKKQMDAEVLSKPEMLYLMLVNQNFEQMFDQVSSMDIPDESSNIRNEVDCLLFLAVISSNQERLWHDNESMLIRYEELLSSYFSGLPLEHLTSEDALILTDNYYRLVFIIGIEKAERFIRIFSADPARCYITKAAFLYQNRLDIELANLDREGVPYEQQEAWFYLCKSLLRSGKHEECLAIIEDMLQNGYEDEQAFHLLYILTQKGHGEIPFKANSLYSMYFPKYDEKIDELDRERTGWTPTQE